MENSMSRILIETTVRQTLKELRENPKRSIRNLVDMALQFSDGRFQSQFSKTTRTMLENENSAYYTLIADAAKDTCILLRELELPYAVYCPYSRENVDLITNGSLFRSAQRLHPFFAVLVPETICPADIS